MAQHRNALGRGLGSLIAMDDAPARGTTAINEIPLDRITPNPDQPRSSFDQEALDELASSIRELGIIQPISLRKTGPDSYQIIAGAASAPPHAPGSPLCPHISAPPPTRNLPRWP